LVVPAIEIAPLGTGFGNFSTLVPVRAMPCLSDEEEMQLHAVPNPTTPTTSSRNDGAGHAESDDEGGTTEDDNDDDDELESPQKKRRKRVTIEYVSVKRWVTGERALLTDEDIARELFEKARYLMALSGLRKTPGHKDLSTDLAMWKKAMQNTDRRGITHTIYRCPLKHRCKCQCAIRVSRGPDFLELCRVGLHDMNIQASHVRSNHLRVQSSNCSAFFFRRATSPKLVLVRLSIFRQSVCDQFRIGFTRYARH
jgi:hypothetical protein